MNETKKTYPFEWMGRTYMLPRELGPNDSMTIDGFIYARTTGDDGMEMHTVMDANMAPFVLS